MLRRRELKRLLRAAHREGRSLEQHGLTFLGIEDGGIVSLLVVEEGKSSEGITVSDASVMLSELGVRECIVLGGKGDVQLISGMEGVLVRPLISDHDRISSKEIDFHLSAELGGDGPLFGRPVGSFVLLTGVESQVGGVLLSGSDPDGW
jgi:hypothetical protein